MGLGTAGCGEHDCAGQLLVLRAAVIYASLARSRGSSYFLRRDSLELGGCEGNFTHWRSCRRAGHGVQFSQCHYPVCH